MFYNKIKEIETKNLIFGLIYSISSNILITILLVGKKDWQIVLAILANILASIYFVLRKVSFTELFVGKEREVHIRKWLSILLAIIFTKNLYSIENPSFQYWTNVAKGFLDSNIITLLVNIVLYAGIIVFFSIVINLFLKKYGIKILKFFGSFTKTEKIYFIIFHIVFIVILLFSYSSTNLFYRPVSKEGIIGKEDVVYTTDTAVLTYQNCYMNQNCVENDVRHPLFTVFSFPFAVLARELANLVPFISYGYYLFLAIVQVSLLCISTICISRILPINEKMKIAFLIASSVNYPMLLFAINLEQYIFAVFFLVAFMYQYIRNNGEMLEDYWVAATGTLITSGVMIFLLFSKDKIKSIKKVIKAALSFLYLTLITGRISVFLQFIYKSESFLGFTGVKIPFTEKLIQFTYYIRSCFLPPFSMIEETTRGNLVYALEGQSTMSYIGILFIITLIVSVIVNRKNKTVKLLAGWSLFSVVILLLIGWGTAENGLILYSLYFAFAYFGILFILLDKIYEKLKYKRIVIVVTYVVISLLAVINLYGIWDLIYFGIQNYPVV